MRKRDERLKRSRKDKAVGTGAVAQKNMEQNKKDFRYPKAGFVTPIEHSLLYATLSAPEVYPEAVIKDAIAEEDFTQYMTVKHESHKQKDEPSICSYAQLSALLALAVQKWPPPQSRNESSTEHSISEILCKSLVKCVVQYAETHNLNRETEVQELLHPAIQRTEKGLSQQQVKVFLPAYVGATASVVTANPLPLWIGYGVTALYAGTATQGFEEQSHNLRKLAATTKRMADAEKTSLLDESEVS